ncbi:MAG TPA: SPASM domain-containing protein [Humisphaera sp.]|nr:SPASM domain-containing protein [Humisphaera sp.]
MKNVTAILSMLHEGAGPNSATRLFRAEPVLRWTLKRLARAQRLDSTAILCWEDQMDHVARIAAEAEAFVLAKGPRVHLPEVESISAARRWSDGWRGGLLSTCDFDLGFYGPWFGELAAKVNAEAVVLVDPAAALVDPHLLDSLVIQAENHPEAPITFVPAAPGLGGALVKRDLLDKVAVTKTHIGRLFHYLPDQISREPLASDWCAPLPTPVARTTQRFKLDSERQLARVSAATVSLNGQLISSRAEEIVHRLHAWDAIDALPRELVLEINTRRSTRPIFWPAANQPIERADFSAQAAPALFEQLARYDDVRLTIAGVGDPLLHAGVFDLIELARVEGIACIHVETDLHDITPENVRRLATMPVDVVSMHLPAVLPQTYAATMGVNGYTRVLENIGAFLAARQGRGVPILVPTFTKCRQNLAEMETWYDQWLRAVGCAVIRGPSDFGGMIPGLAVADMAPSRRSACSRLNSRLTLLCDGRYVSCEQDVLGRQQLGELGTDSIADIWQKRMNVLRADHRAGKWADHPTCATCREWHRP